MVSKVCSLSHGQPCSGSRKRRMICSSCSIGCDMAFLTSGIERLNVLTLKKQRGGSFHFTPRCLRWI
ncbi:Uncharacterised protein [Vibrio cholerae]|nr:Uncharacterised protein [Vibrio cholerae]